MAGLHGWQEVDERARSRWSLACSGVAVFATALALRLIYLAQAAAGPAFAEPLVDAYTYHQMAVGLAAGAPPDATLFWQPIYYPLFLAGVYRVLGVNILVAKVIQALLGALTCLLLYFGGVLLRSRRHGLVAALGLAFYGPAIFYETELLGEGWALFWIAALLLLFGSAARSNAPSLYALLGLAGALAVLTRPPLLPAIGMAGVGLLLALLRRMSPSQALVRLLLVAVVAGWVIAPVARRHRALTGAPGFLPSSSGINLYLGNNPDWERTILIRPGVDWNALVREPLAFGAANDLEASRYFQRKVLEYARTQPASWARGLAGKTVRFFNSRELPRNEDPYLFRRWSPLLRVLLWKAGGFGFPFGVLWPLALVGLAVGWRRLPAPVGWFLLCYPPAIILYFVTARYRLLLVPALLFPAAEGFCWFVAAARARKWPGLCAAAVLAAAAGWLSSRPLSFPEERVDYTAEMDAFFGHNLVARGEYARAVPFLERALARQPDLADAYSELSNAVSMLGDQEKARALMQRALELRPHNVIFLSNLGLILTKEGRLPEAERALLEACEQDARYAPAWVNLGWCRLAQGRHQEALRHLDHALALQPGHAAAMALRDVALRRQAVSGADTPPLRPDTGLRQSY